MLVGQLHFPNGRSSSYVPSYVLRRLSAESSMTPIMSHRWSTSLNTSCGVVAAAAG